MLTGTWPEKPALGDPGGPKPWTQVLIEQGKELSDVDTSFLQYFDGKPESKPDPFHSPQDKLLGEFDTSTAQLLDGRREAAIRREYSGRRLYPIAHPSSAPANGPSTLWLSPRAAHEQLVSECLQQSPSPPSSRDPVRRSMMRVEIPRPSLSAPPTRVTAGPFWQSSHQRPSPLRAPKPGASPKRRSMDFLGSQPSPSHMSGPLVRHLQGDRARVAARPISNLFPRRPHSCHSPYNDDLELERPQTISTLPPDSTRTRARTAELMQFPLPRTMGPSLPQSPRKEPEEVTSLGSAPPAPWPGLGQPLPLPTEPSLPHAPPPGHRLAHDPSLPTAAGVLVPPVLMCDESCQTDDPSLISIQLGNLPLSESTHSIGSDCDETEGNTSVCTDTGRRGTADLSQGEWQEDLQIWVGQVRLNKELPGRLALRQILYGDPHHSAKNADVIALFLMDLVVDKKTGHEELRNRFATVVDDPEEYIFNEEDDGLVFPNVPALRVTRSDGVPRYAALYCCVHKRCVGDWERDGRLNFMDVFPLPLRLACRASKHEPGSKHTADSGDRYILMQDVMLAKRDRFMHLKLMGANLDSHPDARLLQVQELDREFTSWQRDFQKFSAIIFGDFGNRVVCDEEFTTMVEEDASAPPPKEKTKSFLGSPRGSSKVAKSSEREASRACKLTEEGVDHLCNSIAALSLRRSIFLKDNLHWTGRDATGKEHRHLELSARKLRDMFYMHLDLVAKDPDFPVPLPTYPRIPTDKVLSQRLGFKVSTGELITRGQLDRGSNKLRMMNPALDLEELYLPAGNRTLRTNLGPALLLQGGWLDGVGVYRHGIPAELIQYDCDSSLLAFDHVPVKGTVLLRPVGDAQPPLRVWVGAIKLDRRHPETAALEHFMYGHPENSAKDADVIALYFTDLHLTDHNVKGVRNLLRSMIHQPEDYVFNEEDPGLQIKNIPAILVKISEGDPRYVALFVCVHKRNVGSLNGGAEPSFRDAFPLPASLMCRSHLKNDLSPNFKAHLVQDCLLCVGGKFVHLWLFGLNFDTSNAAQQGQVDAMERCMEAWKRDNSAFTAIAFGDFNNRLVVPSELKHQVKLRTPEGGGKPVLKLSPGGVSELIRHLSDPKQRRRLFLTQDSWSWTGVDGIGNEIKDPPECFRKLSEMFYLHRDFIEANANYELPMPTYKRTPIGDFLSRMVLFKLNIKSLITMHHLCEAFQGLKVSDDSPLSAMPPGVVRTTFFGGAGTPVPLDNTNHAFPVMEFGWPDGIGVYKKGPLPIRLESWGTAPEVLGGEHVAMRASVVITITGSSAMPSVQSMNGRVLPLQRG